ncbi:phosphoribosylglycinamide formyltransferase [Usitatibacter palustris]|uniref:Phosphoribosylglycinamide formyltransferase n=1 Tax=Usitatibacter palustris TaxID=2732487 RepID=A0A6M4H415_9PROT|nr:phosphoribosylglycinamide formyltransferase [Usitatibacter palustris]QJR14022.1 Phosphoribosylglycinamide formyltransferase [Usitatibacter palustris]
MKSAVILISGRGSNMQSLVEAGTGLQVRAVISNRPEAKGLEWAAAKGIPTLAIDHKAHASRESFDAALGEAIAAHEPDWILLAGFMRILTPEFIQRFAQRIVNIHPSLLPAFPGLHTHRRAIEEGVKVHGATVHFVTEALDHGPIIIQAAVPVLPSDTEATLAARVLEQEHRIYPQAARWLAEGKVQFSSAGVVQVPGSGVSSDSLIAPRTAA